MGHFWLWVALALYSVGLAHAILTVVQRRDKLFRVALGAVGVGSIFHLVSLVEEGLAVNHFPITTLSESASLSAFLLAVMFLVVHWKYRFESLSVLVFPLIFVLVLPSAFDRGAETWAMPETLKTAWLYLHVSMIVLGYTAFFLTFAAGLLYLLQERELKSKRPSTWFRNLPPLESIDDLAYKSLTIGFPFITIGIVTGAIWASSIWGASWPTDPKIAWAFATWVIYLALLSARWVAGWRGRKAAYIAIVGFLAVLVTWGTNSGLHSFRIP